MSSVWVGFSCLLADPDFFYYYFAMYFYFPNVFKWHFISIFFCFFIDLLLAFLPFY